MQNDIYTLDEQAEKFFIQNLKAGIFKTLQAEGLLTENQYQQLLKQTTGGMKS